MKKQGSSGQKRKSVIDDSSRKDLNKIGERLKHFRKQAGYTSYEFFAYEHGFSRPQYGKYEAGANITIASLSKLLKALNVSYEDFFKGFDTPPAIDKKKK